ncbi:hypothetical protein SBDP1_1530007 [Syntrophobacter sp. SbD1]|nr:hypothetical protein SBDP1_1530007 [Syntrophobacter sp. SbD1]
MIIMSVNAVRKITQANSEPSGSLGRKGGAVSEYIEIMCTSPSDVIIEISQKANEDFEFLSVIVKRPNAFLLRMKHKHSSGPSS